MSGLAYRLPPMQEELLPNGLRVIMIPDTEQETLTVALQFPFGKFSDPPGFEGLTDLAVGLLQKGTVSIAYDEFVDRFEHTGSSLFSEVGDEYVIIGCRMLSRYAVTIVPCFCEMIFAPALRENELKLLKKELVTGIRAESTEPGGIADRHFHSILFGASHPGGRFHTEKSVSRITVDTIREFFRTRISPANATLVIAGSLQDSALADSWQASFGSWCTPAAVPQITVEQPVKLSGRSIRFVEKPDLTQATILLGRTMPGESYRHRGEVALANYILGGGNFSSRLMSHVRSRLGNTYSISSQLSALRNFGIFTIGTATQNAQTGGMIESILEVTGRFHSEGVTVNELEKAKQFVLGNRAFQFEGIGNIAEKVLWLRFHGRDNSYVESYDELVNAITLDGMNHEIREYFDPENIAIVVVGKKDQVLSQLHRFGSVEERHFRSILPV